MLAVAEDQVVQARLRGGPANSGRGAKSFLAETFARVREAGYEGSIVLRADSGFYNHHVPGACDRARVRWSITAKMSPGLQKIIPALTEEDWVPIPYFIEGAAVADPSYTPSAALQPPRPRRLSGRRLTLHLPEHWPWEEQFVGALALLREIRLAV